MSKRELALYEGECFKIEWGFAPNGRCQAQEYYEGMSTADRAKALALFVRMADVGKIYDTTKFTKETDKLFVFKPKPHRFFCFFVKEKRIFIVTACKKQREKVLKREIERAEDVRLYCLKRLAEEEGHGKK